MNLRKIIIITAAAIATISLGFFILNRGVLEVKASTRPIKVKVNDTEYNEADSLTKYLTPGEYQVEVTKDGYSSFRKNVTISPWSKTVVEPELWKSGAKEEKIASVRALYPKTTKDYLFYLNAEDNYFYKLGLKTKAKETISNEPFADIANVMWSPDKSKAIIGKKNLDQNEETEVPKGNQTFVYSFSAGQKIDLPDSLVSYNWSPKGDQIAYTVLEGENYSLYRFLLSGQKILVTKLETGLGKIDWISDSEIILSNYFEEKGKSDIYSINLNNKTVSNITKNGNTYGLLIASNKTGYWLDYADDQTKNLHLINFQDKTTLETDILANSLSDFAPIPDCKLLVKKEDLGDYGVRFAQIDPMDGTETSFYASNNLFVRNLFAASDQRSLIFITSNAIYSLRIKD